MTKHTYEGRRLPRPDEELVDQGLGFDVVTLLSRRQALSALGLGAASIGLAACGASSGAASSDRSRDRHVRQTGGDPRGDSRPVPR